MGDVTDEVTRRIGDRGLGGYFVCHGSLSRILSRISVTDLPPLPAPSFKPPYRKCHGATPIPKYPAPRHFRSRLTARNQHPATSRKSITTLPRPVFHSDRKASTGLIEAARLEEERGQYGNDQQSRHRYEMETPSALLVWNRSALAKWAPAKAAINPARTPMPVKAEASRSIRSRISARLEPTAIRTPISRVRRLRYKR